MKSLLVCVLLACTLASTALEFSNVSNEYIVMFNSYMAHEEHQHILQDALPGMDNQWHIIQRNNPASKFPSDFALISVLGDGVLRHLRHQKFVKHIIPQRRIVNPLQGYELDEEDILANNSTIWGRYHRGFPDFGEGLHMPGTRKLHNSVIQVTDLFNAQEMWAKHSGTSVNVAIFDTGLRKGHSHFRNVIDITNWTDEDSTEDGLGHGTFVAGLPNFHTTQLTHQFTCFIGNLVHSNINMLQVNHFPTFPQPTFPTHIYHTVRVPTSHSLHNTPPATNTHAHLSHCYFSLN